MDNATRPTGASQEAPGSFSVGTIVKWAALLFVDALTLLLAYNIAADGIWELALFISIVTIIVNIINLRDDLMPLQWISPALALMALMVIYPIMYTVFVAFTNYGDGHLLTKVQLVDQLTRSQYLPDDAETYDYVFYQDENGLYALLLKSDSTDEITFARQNQPLEPQPDVNFDEPPEQIGDYSLVPSNQRFQALNAAQDLRFGPESQPIGITRRAAAAFEQRFTYDESLDAVTDQQTETVYVADDEIGEFVNIDAYEAALDAGENVTVEDYALTSELSGAGITGYRVIIGLDNFERFLTSPAISGPLLTIFIWTVLFAILSTFTTFVLGLAVALVLNTDIPFKKVFRTILIVPYAIPALIAVATWKGMLNPNFGVLVGGIEAVFGFVPQFFTDAFWAKFGILMINLWLGYPYYMLVCSGALAAIPSDMYEAAEVDGANAFQRFFNLTLPLLMVAVGPLLIASFTFNFNNFVIIDVYNEGGPPIPDTPTPAGYTDILITYAFRLAFGSGRGQDFGLASAITIIIFIMVAVVTLFQFRFTQQWEETSENV